ncbi:MAG: NAD-dependent epimerase/dehydratase family protein [Nitrososphaera sp.]|jgi:UDP-glucose 4-epimerase
MRAVNTALVTGGAGFIGSHIVDELLSRGIETYVIDNLTTGSLDNLAAHKESSMLHVIVGDVRNAQSLLPNVNIDIVFHEAAIASVPKSVTHPLLVHDVNVNTTLELLNFCVSRGVKRLVFASTAAVYGIIEGSSASEAMSCRPNSPYGASKLSVENYLNAYHMTYGLEVVALRYFNVYGRRQRLSDYSGVITTFVNKMLQGENPVIYGDGTQVRDFVHVEDIVQANMLAMDSQSAVGEVFNVASGRATSILELVQAIKGLIGYTDVTCQFMPSRAGDMKFGVASIDKIQRVLGYKPRFAVQEGLKSVIEAARRETQRPAARITAPEEVA